MKFSLKVKYGLRELANIKGMEIDLQSITLADVQKAIEIEQWLEKMFGLRFHISQEE